MKKIVCIAIHDVAPTTWPQCERLFKMLGDLGNPPTTLLIVPDYHRRGCTDASPDFIRSIDERLHRGDEIALHGYDHLDTAAAPRTPRDWLRRRVLTASEGEFSALDEDEAHDRIDRGLARFASAGWHPSGFVPPAWLASSGTECALRHSSFRYTSTHTTLIDLRNSRRIAAPCLTASPRSAWRRAASKRWLRAAEKWTSDRELVRVGLHPGDAEYQDLMKVWRDVLSRLLRYRQAMTKSQAIDDCSAPRLVG